MSLQKTRVLAQADYRRQWSSRVSGLALCGSFRRSVRAIENIDYKYIGLFSSARMRKKHAAWSNALTALKEAILRRRVQRRSRKRSGSKVVRYSEEPAGSVSTRGRFVWWLGAGLLVYHEINELPLGGVDIGHRGLIAVVVAENYNIPGGCTIEMGRGRPVVGGGASFRGCDNCVIICECQPAPGYCVDAGVAATSGKPVLHAHVVYQARGVEVVVRLAGYCEP